MKKIVFITLGLIVIGFVGCKPDEDEKPDPTTETTTEVADMTVTINHKIGMEDLDFTSEFTLPSAEKVKFGRFAYILSDFYLTTTADEKVSLGKQFAFIEVNNNKTTFTLKNVPMGNYKSVGLSIGLDSATNHGNPNYYLAEHPLAPINNSLYWGWTAGYVYTAIEGLTVANDESFIFHLSGVHNKTDFDLPIAFIKKEGALKATLEYDVAEVFKNPEIYTISIDGASTHSITDAITTKLFANMVDVFSVKSVTE
jgi:hypothetical protein